MATTKTIEVSCRRRSVRDDKEDRLVQIDPPNIFEDGPSARICLLITSNGLTTFSELRRIFPLNYGLYVNRVKLESPLNVANLMNVADELPTAASEILPDIKVDAMAYTCTSGAMVLGSENTRNLILIGRPDVTITSDPFTASVAALRYLDCKRITVLAPYIKEANEKMFLALQELGFEVVKYTGFGLSTDEEICRVPFAFIKKTVLNIFDSNLSDVLFIPCTSLVVTEHIDELESVIGRPVVTAIQALAWHLITSIAREREEDVPCIEGFGKLFKVQNDKLMI